MFFKYCYYSEDSAIRRPETTSWPAKFCRTSQQVPKGHIWKGVRIAKGRGKISPSLNKDMGIKGIIRVEKGLYI